MKYSYCIHGWYIWTYLDCEQQVESVMKAVKKWTLKFELEGPTEDEDNPVPYIVAS